MFTRLALISAVALAGIGLAATLSNDASAQTMKSYKQIDPGIGNGARPMMPTWQYHHHPRQNGGGAAAAASAAAAAAVISNVPVTTNVQVMVPTTAPNTNAAITSQVVSGVAGKAAGRNCWTMESGQYKYVCGGQSATKYNPYAASMSPQSAE